MRREKTPPMYAGVVAIILMAAILIVYALAGRDMTDEELDRIASKTVPAAKRWAGR